MKGRIVAMGILSLIGMITFVFLCVHLFKKVETIYDVNTGMYTNNSLHLAGRALIEGAIVGITAFASIVLGIVHLSGNKEPERGLNIAAGVLAIVFGGINWIICLITFIKLSKTSQTAQAEK